MNLIRGCKIFKDFASNGIFSIQSNYQQASPFPLFSNKASSVQIGSKCAFVPHAEDDDQMWTKATVQSSLKKSK